MTRRVQTSSSKKTFDITKTEYYQYALDCLDGKIVCGHYTKKACERFLNDCKRDDLVFDHKKVQLVFAFLSSLKHTDAPFTGKPFILEDFQKFIVANLYGWRRKNPDGTMGRRRYKQCLVNFARKQGKSALIAGLSLAELILGGAGGQIICASNTRNQATLIFDHITKFASSIDGNQKYIKRYRSTVAFPKTNSKCFVVSSEAGHLDGYSPTLILQDELQEAKTDLLTNVLQSGMGTRPDGLLVQIMTAGFNKEYYGYDQYSLATQVLDGTVEDDTFAAFIYQMDADDDVHDRANWKKAQPGIGTISLYEFMEEEERRALNNPTKMVDWLTKLCNKWVDHGAETWIGNEHVRACMKKVNLGDYRDCMAYGSVDLASVDDLASISFKIFPKDGGDPVFYTEQFLPINTYNKGGNSEIYKKFKSHGAKLTVTSYVTNCIDVDAIVKRLVEIGDILTIYNIGYDSWGSSRFSILATEQGLPIIPVSQSIGNFSRGVKQLQATILQHGCVINTDPLIEWEFGNCVIKEDINQNQKIVKEQKKQKIDGIITMCMCEILSLDNPLYESEMPSTL